MYLDFPALVPVLFYVPDTLYSKYMYLVEIT